MMEADAIHDLHMSHHHTSMCHIIIPIYALWNIWNMWNIHIRWSKMMEADAIHDDKIVSNVEQMQNQADKEVNTICRIQNTKRIYTILLRSIIVFYISQYYIQQCAVLFYIQQYSIYSSAQYFRLLYIVVLLQQYLVNAGPDRQKGEYYIYNIEYSTYIYCDTAQYYSLLYIIFTQYHYIQNTIILHTLLFTFCSICYSSKDSSKDSVQQ